MLEIWTSENCNHCKAIKEYLNNNKIEYIEKVLDIDFNVGDLIVETSKRGNPTMSFPVIMKDNICYTTRQFVNKNYLDEMWLGENVY